MLLTNFFSAGQGGYYILVLAFMLLLVGLFLWGSSKKEKDSRAARLELLYTKLDGEKLAQIPDEELVDAVIANLNAKQDKRRPDAYHTIPLLSRGRCAVYSVWLICHELDVGSFEDCFAGPSGVFSELAADGFELIGAIACSAAVRTALQAEDSELAELHADFLEAVETEQPLQKCVDYIRSNPEEFVDVPVEETSSFFSES